MASIKEIRTHIKSVEQTLKITNAMYLISSSSLRKARRQLTDVEPYFSKIEATISDILHHSPEIDHRFFDKDVYKRQVECFHPLEGVYCAVTRRDFTGNGPFLPEQALTPYQALYAYTAGGAYASGEERIKGRIRSGLLADFLLVDRNLLTLSLIHISMCIRDRRWASLRPPPPERRPPCGAPSMQQAGCGPRWLSRWM